MINTLIFFFHRKRLNETSYVAGDVLKRRQVEGESKELGRLLPQADRLFGTFCVSIFGGALSAINGS